MFGDTMKKFIIKLIRKYQESTTGKNPSCKYKPSCSNYAVQAFENYNFFYAAILSIWRILRCNPFSKGGYDPIPKYKKELKKQLTKEKEETTKKDPQ